LGLRRLSSPDQHVHQDQTERVDVGTVIDRGALRLLGRHVFQRADDRAGYRSAARSCNRARNPKSVIRARSSSSSRILRA
jgi:hypothetical protein